MITFWTTTWSRSRSPRLPVRLVTKTGMVMVCGVITSKANIDYQKVDQNTVKHIRYDNSSKDFDYKMVKLMVLKEQSPEIAMGVHLEKET